jgi:hypothetical protein
VNSDDSACERFWPPMIPTPAHAIVTASSATDAAVTGAYTNAAAHA